MRFIYVQILVLTGMIQALGQISSSSPVRLWEEPLILPTYLVQPPNKNPMFYVPANYQGAQRVLYPYPQNDGLTNTRQDRTYQAVYLENEYVKVCVVPEFGGKLFYALDKTNGYPFIYRQNVVKPSNIGMLGAWTSGGIEWCVFHHHRASTFLPVDYQLVDNQDGSKTVWVGEIEPRQRMKWSIGITLHPGRSDVEVTLKMFNRTPQPHSLLFWANVATHANAQYRTLFPPSVNLAVFHAKNSFVHWPISQEAYAGHANYATPTDLSWWKNHPEPVSFFAHELKEGFIGGYDYGRHTGTVAVGNHHIVAGVKLWEWGPGPVGQAWDNILSDQDGPYSELMVGAFSDNQPDYSWIKPYEVKTAQIKWYSLRDLQGLTRANEAAAMNLEQREGQLLLAFNTTQAVKNARVTCTVKGQTVYDQQVDIDPAHPFSTLIAVPPGTQASDCTGSLYTADGTELISYRPAPNRPLAPLPPVVEPPLPPDQILTNEECYLAGLRIKQFHHATMDPNPYFEEVLRRDPGDARSNVMLGLDLKQRGRYEEAAVHFRRAVARLTKDYTRPRDGEALYHLGVTLKALGKFSAAYDTLYRATWDYAFFAPAHMQLAQISASYGDYATALEHVQRALTTAAESTISLNLKSALLRQLNRPEDAEKTARQVLAIDPLDLMARYELYQMSKDPAVKTTRLTDVLAAWRNEVQNYLETAVDYINFGLPEEAIQVLELTQQPAEPGLKQQAEVHYLLAYLYSQQQEENKAQHHLQQATTASTDYVFPYRLETLPAWYYALKKNPQDGRAQYYLGNLLYDRQPQEAMRHWSRGTELAPDLAIAWRNMGFGYHRHVQNLPLAIQHYETAIRINPADPTYYLELDKLYALNNTDPAIRWRTMQPHQPVLQQSNDLFMQYLHVLVLNRQLDEAIQHLSTYAFTAAEGNDWIHDIHVNAHLLKGLQWSKMKKKKEALKTFLQAMEYPANQRLGRTSENARDIQVHYYVGAGYELNGQKEQATAYYQRAAGQACGDNEYLYFKALALQKIGKPDEAKAVLERLKRYAESQLQQDQTMDFFAKFGEADGLASQQANGHYALGLVHLAENQMAAARSEFAKALERRVDHVWAKEMMEE